MEISRAFHFADRSHPYSGDANAAGRAPQSAETTFAQDSTDASQAQQAKPHDRDSRTGGSPSDLTHLRRAVDEVNQHLGKRDTRVELQYDPAANRIWLNIVDQHTGQVIQEIPPEGIRRLLEGDLQGLISDKII
jgi:uncharacterized FlaG/YvyC family protein